MSRTRQLSARLAIAERSRARARQLPDLLARLDGAAELVTDSMVEIVAGSASNAERIAAAQVLASLWIHADTMRPLPKSDAQRIVDEILAETGKRG